MKKSKTLESCPLCGAQKQPPKKSRPIPWTQTAPGKSHSKIGKTLAADSGDDKTADNFAELRRGLVKPI
jgi:hypothetical protein